MEKSYKRALGLLNSRKARPKPRLEDMRGSDDMTEWLQLLGYSAECLNSLNIIHIAGTKGKGSTAVFAESFLRVHGITTGYPQKIGLYTSPHLKNIRERIRINWEPISEELFAKSFFEVWDRLPKDASEALDVPRYLQLLALISFHVFIKEGVDVAIYETHFGGEYDATNIVQRPVATGITTIGMDHVKLLGPSIESIAWHKGGIFKPGSLAFSAFQEPVVATVLQRRAVEKQVTLKFVGIDSLLPINAKVLKPEIQKTNSSLALALVGAFLKEKAPNGSKSITPHDIVLGIEQFFWPGRFHQILDGNYQWFLDGAHNELSVQHAAKWFAETASELQSGLFPRTRILIFSNFSERDGVALLSCIAKSLRENRMQLQHVIFSTYDERQDGITRIDKNLQNRFSSDAQERYANIWKSIDPKAEISLERTIEGALKLAKMIGDQGNGMQTLITGSLHLVGGALSLGLSTPATTALPE
ncbi:MAG: hypothetical protein M1834_000937 [Cirrosporium novae-zelandiae]|nr:MAG: hypothetical protein M1834_000937 [Cirrosporium novae-zelandiae]